MLTFTLIAAGIGIMVLAFTLFTIFSRSNHITIRDDQDHVTHNPDDMNKLHEGTYRPQDDEGF